MKKLVVIMLVLSMAVVANSAMFISVNGVVDPPDSSINIRPSEVVILDIWSDGQLGPETVAMGIGMASPGPGSLDASKAVLPQGGVAMMVNDADAARNLGVQNPFISLDLPGYQGTVADQILFHCDGPGDVTITLVNPDGIVIDTQVIHQIPEPITVALLGLGGLFIRRRIA